MGSSPVTATIPTLSTNPSPPPPPFVAPPAPASPRVDALAAALACSLPRLAPVAANDRLVVAFSGGPDSTALLLALVRLAPVAGWRLLAGHVDHRLDPGAAGRAAAAGRLAAALDVPFALLTATSEQGPESALAPGAGPEATARAFRYAELERLRQHSGARWILTAHHADDQAETVLLRLLYGSGIAGLAGIPARRGAVLRPLLATSRAALAAVVAEAGLQPVRDPTNRDLARPRNRLRHQLLAGAPALAERALALANAAAAARRQVAAGVAGSAPVQAGPRGPRLALAALAGLPPELRPWALAELNAQAGLPYPPRRRAAAELARQLGSGGEVACDCAAGWRWVAREGFLELAAPATSPRRDASAGVVPFAYTLAAPGGVEIREAATIFRLTRQPVAPWMRQGSATRAALDLPLATGGLVTVRNRRPGDHLQPLGCAFERRLKDVLIDRKVPRLERDRLPLLCFDDRVVWVPGVTVHHAFRLRQDGRMAWVAELLPAAGRVEEVVR